MRRLAISATALALAFGAVATAQEHPHFRRTTQAVVESVDVAGRILTVKRPEGYYLRLHVPDSIATFASVKVADAVTVTYIEDAVLNILPAGAVAHDREPVAPPPGTPAPDSGSPDAQILTTATITNLDENVGTLSFTDAAGLLNTVRIEDRDLIKRVRLGDKVDLTLTQAVVVSLK